MTTPMTYTVHQLATLSGVSVRTLHYYDSIGLLSPARVRPNGYREYEEPELLTLQQILFFRELDFPLEEIKKIMHSKGFDMRQALRDQRGMLQLKKKRLTALVRTIDKTIKKINKETHMKDEEIFKAFEENEKTYGAEVRERWGNTDAYKQSAARVKKMSKEDMIAIKKAGDQLMREITDAFLAHKLAHSHEVQKLIERHFNGLRAFYEPTLALYRGLADMFVADPRFTAYYDGYAKGLALYMREAMHAYCSERE